MTDMYRKNDVKRFGKGEHTQGLTELVCDLIPKYFHEKGFIGDFGCGRMRWEYKDNRVESFDCIDSDFPNFTKCDLNEDIPRHDGYFNNTISLETIEHLENPMHFLRELKRITTGISIISFPRGIASGWYNPMWYEKTGHIQILEPWLIKMHLDKIGYVLVDEFNLNYQVCVLVFKNNEQSRE